MLLPFLPVPEVNADGWLAFAVLAKVKIQAAGVRAFMVGASHRLIRAGPSRQA